MRVLAIDPGELTGYAYITPQEILSFGNIPYKDIQDFLADWDKPIDVIVLEDYKQFKQKAHKKMGDRFKTVRVIGYVEFLAKMKKVPLMKQDSDVIPTAIKRTGINPAEHGAHKDTHWGYALLHGMYFLTKIGKAKSALQKAKGIG